MFKIGVRKKILLGLAALCAVSFILCAAFLFTADGAANAESTRFSDDFSDPPTRVEKPSFSLSELVYDKKEHKVEDFGLIGFDERIMDISADKPSICEVGDYHITVSFKSGINYCWTDGTRDEQTHSLSIKKLVIVKPAGELKIAYNGLLQKFMPEGLDESWVSLGGNAATARGQYTATASLLDKDNTCWNDGTSGDITFVWEITRGVLKIPSAKDDIRYSGKDIGAEQNLINFNPALMELSGDLTGRNAGVYSVTVKLKDSENYGWEQPSGEASVTVEWEIKKARLQSVWIKNAFTPFIAVPSDFINLVDFDYVYSDAQGNAIKESEFVNNTDYSAVAKIKREYTGNFEFAGSAGGDSAESEPCAFKAKVVAGQTQTPSATPVEENKMEQWQFWILLGMIAANILAMLTFCVVIVTVISKKGNRQPDNAQATEKPVESEPAEQKEEEKPQPKPAPKTLKEAYAALSLEQTEYFDGLRDYAAAKPFAVAVEQNNYQWVVCDDKPIIALGIRDGVTLAVIQNASEEGKPRNAVISVIDGESFDSAKQMIDLRAQQLLDNREN